MARLRRLFLLVFAVMALGPGTSANAAEPPWCGTPEPDASLALDGFPHIPYYAIGCTLDSIAAQSNGRMKVEVIGQSALGRNLYLVTINELTTSAQRRDFANWQVLRERSRSKPKQAQNLLQDGAECEDAVHRRALQPDRDP